MDKSVETLTAEIADLQTELDAKIEQQVAHKGYSVAGHDVQFDEETRAEHHKLRAPLIPYMRSLTLGAMISGPFVYAMIVPIMFLDISLVIYQSACFRLWRIPLVRRSKYVVVDRQYLGYLNGMEKFNCIFCGYANGVFGFAAEIAGCTEKYWCPIKHAHRMRHPHAHYREFTEFGDAEAWHEHPAGKSPEK